MKYMYLNGVFRVDRSQAKFGMRLSKFEVHAVA